MDDQNDNAQQVPVNPADTPADEPMEPADEPVNEESDALEALRQQAVEALIPLVDNVEGSPEYKFEMLMNALQAKPHLVLMQKAMDTANQIEDPSVKAQALVDLLNISNAM